GRLHGDDLPLPGPRPTRGDARPGQPAVRAVQGRADRAPGGVRRGAVGWAEALRGPPAASDPRGGPRRLGPPYLVRHNSDATSSSMMLRMRNAPKFVRSVGFTSAHLSRIFSTSLRSAKPTSLPVA